MKAFRKCIKIVVIYRLYSIANQESTNNRVTDSNRWDKNL